ncbi:hypothetical protein N7535_005701 [Penicillium sp. DV-2018c]|nr:hypothetical protein N7461_009276 [Penicillium sp. DV-2018c]KAJ5572041.1 hypothetical protein N7535_005701 [Penicillium sp. DV-2018c]
MSSVKEGRITKPKPKKPRSKTRRVSNKVSVVEQTNALSIEDFIAQYVTPLTQASPSKNEGANLSIQVQNQSQQSQAGATLPLEIYSSATISASDLEACLDLIEQTSSEDYAAAASGGWSRTKKRKEMKLPDMKFLILRDVSKPCSDSSGTDAAAEKRSQVTDRTASSGNSDEVVQASDGGSPNVLGFLSFMVTYEDGKEVVYCYEIHLSPAARGRGLGRVLMDWMESIGRAVGLEKAMLTVFKSNNVARRFYERLGYEVDEFSPRPRRLRNGTIKEYGYLILSKMLRL